MRLREYSLRKRLGLKFVSEGGNKKEAQMSCISSTLLVYEIKNCNQVEVEWMNKYVELQELSLPLPPALDTTQYCTDYII